MQLILFRCCLGVSWILTTGRRLESTDEIYTVINWPGAGSAKELQRKVPSEYTYSAMGGKSWGYGISDSQYVIRWMKLQLRPPSRYDALQTLVQNLKDAPLLVRMDQRPDEQRPLPMHLIKAPVDVVTAYMSEVADSVLESIRAERDESTLEEYPIDLVITHPAEWPETAINLTMKAITEAFAVAFSGVKGGLGANFRQVFLATEPEACAQMTMNDAMKDKTSNLRAVCEDICPLYYYSVFIRLVDKYQCIKGRLLRDSGRRWRHSCKLYRLSRGIPNHGIAY